MVPQALTKQRIVQSLSDMPDDTLAEVLQFVEFLRFRAAVPTPRRVVQLRGLWADIPFDVTNEDIRSLRHQLTEQIGRKEV